MPHDDVHIHIHGLDEVIRVIRNVGLRIGGSMSALGNKIDEMRAELNTALDAATARIQEDVAGLQAKVAELEALVAAGGATPEDLAKLEEAKAELQARINAIDPVSPETLPVE